MTIYEAAERALRELGSPTHQSILREYIEANGYYVFGAKESAAVLGVELSRRAANVRISRAIPEKIFYREKQGDRTPAPYRSWAALSR